MTESLRLLTGVANHADPYDRVREALQPAFLGDVYVPFPDDAALWGHVCSVDGCVGWDSNGSPSLCARHRSRLHYKRVSITNGAGDAHGRDLSRERFIADTSLNGGPVEVNDHPGFDFRGLPPKLELELRLFV